jgi:cysteine desulfurase/selenocysteine lyase
MYDLDRIRADFPILATEVYPGVPLVYLDSAASSQKPAAVIAAMDDYYRRYHANVHRGVHRLSELATTAYEGARVRVAEFIHAAPEEIIFVGNATEGFNLVAQSWGRANVRPGRRDPADGDGAPRQPRPVADAGRRARRDAALPAVP